MWYGLFGSLCRSENKAKEIQLIKQDKAVTGRRVDLAGGSTSNFIFCHKYRLRVKMIQYHCGQCDP
jgi:hypothetical protein